MNPARHIEQLEKAQFVRRNNFWCLTSFQQVGLASLGIEKLTACCAARNQLPDRSNSHLTVIVTVAVLGSVSVPPGPNVMVPVDWNTVPCAVVAGGVTFVVTIIVCGGLAPFLVDPPRLGVVTSIRPPAVVLNVPGQGALNPPVGVNVQLNVPLLFTVTAMLFSCKPAGMVFLNRMFCAAFWVVLLMVHTMFPA